jgi:hypothetical protein
MDKAELRACLEQADAKEAGALLRAALRNKMREALMEIYEEEVQGLCGPSHSRDSKSDYYRAGSSPAKVKLGEHEHTIRRSRVRKSLGDASAEKHLATWKAARDPEAWEESLFRAVLCGVSTRSCAEAARKRAEGAFLCQDNEELLLSPIVMRNRFRLTGKLVYFQDYPRQAYIIFSHGKPSRDTIKKPTNHSLLVAP